MQTLLTQIEACLNSRSLTPLPSDPNDLNPLTPGHFLTGAPLNAIPEHDTTFTATNRLSRKWKRSTPDVIINALVIIREDNTPPVTWRMGRIIMTHPGTDGHVRVVTIKTAPAAAVLKRSITKIPCDKKFQVDQHLGTKIHKEKKQTPNTLVQQLFTNNQAVKNSPQENFSKDLTNLFVSLNIPLHTIDHPLFQQFFKTYCPDSKIISSSTLHDSRKRQREEEENNDTKKKSRKTVRTPPKKKRSDTEMEDLKSMIQKLMEEVKEIRKENHKYHEILDKLAEENKEIKRENNEMKTKMQYMEDKIEQMERHQKKNNIVIYGMELTKEKK
ncbi:hypothetical protein GEV33_008556 [Tenebrio molitor]|uniref:DUF5641 domain-containing protein n=1 Tax=Tenebrio molitor TaxID=7067 RepID=A0A8J6LAK9_TENMO|nr:hypothetical protein GEV33_008556 [Tenebrio molitor]